MLENKLGIALNQTKDVTGWLIVDGVQVLKFSLPGRHSGTDLSPGAEARLKKDSKLRRRQFLDLVDCTLEFEPYVEMLRSKGILPEA
jgi:hypothetical protein